LACWPQVPGAFESGNIYRKGTIIAYFKILIQFKKIHAITLNLNNEKKGGKNDL
jgi:hypothetical protein